jgi:hypothetical protein
VSKHEHKRFRLADPLHPKNIPNFESYKKTFDLQFNKKITLYRFDVEWNYQFLTLQYQAVFFMCPCMIVLLSCDTTGSCFS